MSKVVNVSEKDFKSEVLDSKTPVLVDFWAPWCGPCRMMTPVLDELSYELDGKLKVVKVNVDEPDNALLSQQYQIMSIPNMKLFKGGAVIEDYVGFRPKEVIQEELQKHIS